MRRMPPYGVRHDCHRYLLNDNGVRDADLTRLARKRARRLGIRETLSASEEYFFLGEYDNEMRMWDLSDPDGDDWYRDDWFWGHIDAHAAPLTAPLADVARCAA